MMDERDDRAVDEERRVEGNLVQVVDDDVVPVPGEARPPDSRHGEVEGRAPPAATDHVDPIQGLLHRGVWMRHAEQVDPMARLRDPGERLSEVDLGAARLRMGPVLPVDDEDLHAEGRRATTPIV
jgi:hypothetical protein